MSKQINQYELAHVFCRLLLDQNMFSDQTAFNQFVSDAAKLVTDYCGGFVSREAITDENDTLVSISACELLPEDGGIWQAYDFEGDCFNNVGPKEIDQQAILDKLQTYVICRHGDQSTLENLDAVMRVNFPNLIEAKYKDYDDCPEWNYLTRNASFQHTEVGEIILHAYVMKFDDKAPEVIKKVIDEANLKGVTWVLFSLDQ